MKRIGIATLVAFAVASPAGFAAQQELAPDLVRTRAGQTVRGRVMTEDYAKLTIKPDRQKVVEIAWDDVDAVAYADDDVLAPARAAIEKGQFEPAATLLRSIAGDKVHRDVLRQRALYLYACATFRAGSTDAAIAACAELASTYPGGRYAADAVCLQARALVAAGQTEKAETAAREAGVAGRGSLPERFGAEMDLLLAEIRLAAGRSGPASELYTKLAANADPAIAAEAKLGLAQCERVSGRAAAAEQAFRALLREDANPRRQEAACSAIADLMVEAGGRAPNAERLLEAAHWYVRAAVLHVPRPDDLGGSLDHALAGSARAFQAVADASAGAATKALYARRSAERWQELRRIRPDSPLLAGAPPAPEAPTPASDAEAGDVVDTSPEKDEP